MGSGNMKAVKQRQNIIEVDFFVIVNYEISYKQIRNENSDFDIGIFILMLEKENKQIYKHIYIAINSDMALHFNNQRGSYQEHLRYSEFRGGLIMCF